MNAPTHSAVDLILWDVVEEHLDEAEFLFEQWVRTLHSPTYSLADLGAIYEHRLVAHLDGLVVGGREVASHILKPELEKASEPARVAVAALALLLSEEEDFGPRVVQALPSAEPPIQEALTRVLVLSGAESLDALVLERFRRAEADPEKALWLKILTGRGVDPGALLLRTCLDSDDPTLLTAALEELRRHPRGDMGGEAERRLRSEHPGVRNSALHASLTLGSFSAWQLCLELARTSTPPDPDILIPIAALGRAADHAILFGQLSDPCRLERTLWTLGFCGTAEAGDLCVSYLLSQDERIAKIAADALAWIAGIDLKQECFRASACAASEDDGLPPLEAENLGACLSVPGVEDLPVPNAEALSGWWEENRGRVANDGRQILGKPLSMWAILHAMQAGSLWRRHGLGLELCIRSGGTCQVSSLTFSQRQHSEIAALAHIDLGQWFYS